MDDCYGQTSKLDFHISYAGEEVFPLIYFLLVLKQTYLVILQSRISTIAICLSALLTFRHSKRRL